MSDLVSLGAYNLYAKRASFKDDGVLQQFVAEMAGQPVIAPPVLEERVPIVTGDEDETELSTEEIEKRKDFERRRKELTNTSGLDIKAVLGHRLSLAPEEEDDDEEDETVQSQSASFKDASPTASTQADQQTTVSPAGEAVFSDTTYAEPSRVTGEETVSASFKVPTKIRVTAPSQEEAAAP
ncbi:unnamed protein product [Dibothriocephalus latus]|uniref:Uncharacterized protein n=1 Tax=Dibothriocephalus latus TaxID=60516 RepID=A0A3P6T4H2_DIBLA|nr:unnamed protein product [Dibothriocephalus latus]